jgi:hypothetical protein
VHYSCGVSSARTLGPHFVEDLVCRKGCMGVFCSHHQQGLLIDTRSDDEDSLAGMSDCDLFTVALW